MKSTLRFTGLLAVLMLLIYACQKEKIPKLDQNEEAEMETTPSFYTGSNTFSIGGDFANSRTATLTVLGNERVNPYTVEKMTEAYNILYDPDLSAVPTTDVYVKFCPQDYEELAALFETDIVLYDFPLEYEVIEMGDYYEDPNLGPEDIPCFYAIIKPSFTFPAVNYEIIDHLHLARYETHMTEKAFELTGNPYDGVPRTLCDPGDPDYPYCLCTPLLGEDWPDCLEDDYDWSWATGGGEPDPYFNACGCEVYEDPKKPGGCINVQDTELGLEGVKNVRVILKDTWFTQDVVYTNDLGCFKLSKRYNNNVWMWVKFKNGNCKIRGKAQGLKFWDWVNTIKDYVGNLKNEYGDDQYNNVEVNYFASPDHDSQAHRYWGAATVMNALDEFHDEALIDGINVPPANLDIYIAKDETFGFALMAHKLGPVNVGELLAYGLATSPFFEDPTSAIIGGLGVGATAAVITKYLPDIVIGTDFNDSDNLKNLAYHEIAHTSHYTQVGNDYWKALGIAEISANGWGDGTEPDAGRVQVCESWAEHIGCTYTDRKYELEHSNTPNPQFVNEFRWINLLERDLFDQGHVPVAIFHDLIDNNAMPIAGSTENGSVTADGTTAGGGVTGYNNASIFSQLSPTTVTPVMLREQLKTILPTGVSGPAVDALFLDYGY